MGGTDYTKQPAQQTRLGNDSIGFQPLESTPDIGLYLRTSAPQRPKNSAANLKNLHFDGISWSPTNTGYKLIRSTVFNGGASFKEFGTHWLPDKTSRLVFQVGTKVYTYDPFDDAAVETLLFTAASESIPCFRSFSPVHLIYTNGVNQPQNWDGTTWTASVNFPFNIGSDAYTKPALCETFQGRMVYGGFDSLPFQVFISEFGDPDGIDVTGVSPARAGSFPVPSTYGPVTSLKSIRINASTNEEILIVGCKRGVCFVQGTDSDSFVIIPVTDRFGIVNNRCWLKIDDNYAVLCTDGIRSLSSNLNLSNLVNTALTYHVHPIITARNSKTANDQPFVIDNPDRLEAVFYFPRAEEITNRQGLVFNYSQLSSQGFAMISEKEYPRGFNAGTPACGINYEGLLLCGSYGGFLQSHWVGNFFGTTPITYNYLSPLVEPPTPAQEASCRMMQILCEGSGQQFTAKAWVYSTTLEDQVRRNESFKQDFISQVSGDTIIGKWVIGQSAFGGASYQIFNFYPKHAGRAWELEITGTTANGGTINFIGFFSTLVAGGTRQ